MAQNGISTLATKELRQKAKLDLAATKRASTGRTSTYDINKLPTKYVGNEAQTDSTKWNYIKKTIENIDAQLERLVITVKKDKEMEEEQKRYDDQLNDFNWVGSKWHY